MNLSDIEVFLQVAEGESLSRAARLLRRPKATVSHQIRRLESELGMPLFDRDKNAISLNPEGKNFRPFALDILRTADRATEYLRASQTAQSTEIRVASSTEFASDIVGPIMLKFSRTAPDVRLTATTFEKRLLAEARRQFDCIIYLGDPPLPQFSKMSARLLGRIQFGLFASPAYLGARTPPRTPNKLRQHDLIHVFNEDAASQWHLAHGEEMFKLLPEPHVMTNDHWIAKLCAVHDEGICFLPTIFVGAEVDAGLLQPVLPEWKSAPIPVYALFWPHRTGNKNLRIFLDVAAQRMQELDEYVYSANRVGNLARR